MEAEACAPNVEYWAAAIMWVSGMVLAGFVCWLASRSE